jgi:hypothetical protein
MAAPGHTLVLLDGDKRLVPEFVDPDTIASAQDDTLAAKIKEQTGVDPELTVDGGIHGGNSAQRVQIQRKYLAWLRKNVAFIPTLCPEELILRAAGEIDAAAKTSQNYKDRLRALAVTLYGQAVSNERTDLHGETLLAATRHSSTDLAQLVSQLDDYLASVHP